MTTETAPPPRRRRSRQETRERLMEAALSVFARNGYERATVDEIVREAGFSKGAFYVHFEAKEDLFWEMLQERIEAQQEALREALDPSLSITENERRILEVVFNTQATGPMAPAIFLEFAAHAMRNEKVRERLSEMYSRWHAFVVEVLEGGRAAGAVRSDLDIPLVASVMMAIIEGTMIQSNIAPKELRLNGKIEPLSQLLADWLGAR